jgi:solute:Na+ symporter, SSS family
MRMHPCLRVLFCTTLFMVGAPLHASSLAPVHHGELPSLETTSLPSAIAVVDGQPLAISGSTAWRLDEASHRWVRLAWPATRSDAAGIIEGGPQTWLLTAAPNTQAAQAVTGVARLRIQHDELQLRPLAPLPGPLHDARGAWSGDILSVAGIDGAGSAQLWQIRPYAEHPQWVTLAGWPGGGPPTSLVAQSAAVFITTGVVSGGAERLLRWTADTGWTERGRVPGRLVPGSGHALGQADALYLVREGAGDDAPAKLKTFQTITSAWATLPGAAPIDVITTGAWTDGMFWARRDSSGKRLDFGYARVQSTTLLLRWLDWIVIVVYLAGMIGIGLFFYLREKRNSTSNFFVGGRTIPYWAAGVSLYAANTSSISFIAIPAKAFESNWNTSPTI